MTEDIIWALIGGALIGLAASAFLILNGRIAGISGILGSSIDATIKGTRPSGWRLSFIAGLIVGGTALGLIKPSAFPEISMTSSGAVLLVIAGVCVGFGTRLGSGCTSGHGVCGVARLSPRSFVATVTFIAFGVATVAATRALGLYS